MLLSNQIKCKACGESISSQTMHDYQPCSCGLVAVYGGMSYARRAGKAENYIEESIFWDERMCRQVMSNIDWALTHGRNDLGIMCAVARAIRDSGYKVVKNDNDN